MARDFDDDIPPIGDIAPQRSENPKPIDWPSLEGKEPPKREWAIDHWLGVGHATLMAGRGSTGKTLMAQTIGAAASIQRDYIGKTSRQLRVLMWCCEDDHDELWRRQSAISEHYGLPLSAFKFLYIIPRVGLENALMATVYGVPQWTPLVDYLREQVNDWHIDILFLDNARQIFLGNENDASAVTKLINGLCGLRPNMAVVILAHTAKAQGSEFSGNAAWENVCRMRWYLGRDLPDDLNQNESDDDKESDARYLCKRKTNYSALDYIKFEYVDGVLIPEERVIEMSGFDSRLAVKMAEGVIRDAVPRLLKAGEYPNNTTLVKLVVQFGLHQNVKKGDLTKAMRNMLLDGRLIRQEIGKYSNATPRFGLIAV